MSRENEQTRIINSFIGKKIKELRFSKGLPRLAIAEAIDVTHQQLQKYELGRNRISASRLALLANFLEVDIKEFFEFSEAKASKDQVENAKFVLAISKNLMSVQNDSFKKAINELIKAYNTESINN